MRIKNIHSRIANYISKNKTVQKTILLTEKNPAYVNSLICAGIGIIAKPATIMLMPSKNSEINKDKQYGIARSVSTGVIDFIFALALFSPINKHIDNSGRKLFEKKGSIYYQNKELVTNAKSMMNRAFRFATLPIFAYMKFKFIDPTVKILFKDNKK